MTSIKATGARERTSESGHWYTRDGKPMYEVPNVSSGGMRPTTIRDARKLNLVPSATTIMKGEAKPQLINWLVQQGMMACLTLPRLPGEDDTKFIERALDDSKQQVYKAAERGQYLHGLMESWLRHGNSPSVSEQDLCYVRPAVEYIYQTFPGYTWDPESSFAWHDTQGQWYGGKRDLCGTHPTNHPVVVDYKCKDFVKDSKKQLAWNEHVTQLAAYGMPYGREFTALNLFVSTNEANVGHFVPVSWSQPEIVDGRRAFLALLDLWYARNDL